MSLYSTYYFKDMNKRYKMFDVVHLKYPTNSFFDTLWHKILILIRAKDELKIMDEPKQNINGDWTYRVKYHHTFIKIFGIKIILTKSRYE